MNKRARTENRSRTRLIQRCLGAAGLIGVATNCLAADRSWTNTLGGTFSTVSNWQNGLFAGVNDAACFNNSSIFFPPGQTTYTINFSGNAQNQAIKVRNDFVTFNLAGRSYTTTQVTGNEIGTVGGGGTILVARSARLTIQNGTFNITNTTLTPQMLIGAASGGLGTLSIDTGGTLTGTARILVGGPSASGTFTLLNGGSALTTCVDVGSGASGFGTAIFNGPFSTLTSGTLAVGNAGNGTMQINIGATVQNNGTAIIGNAAGIRGIVTIDSSIARWNQGGTLIIGNSGIGTVNTSSRLQGATAILAHNPGGSSGVLNVTGSAGSASFTDLTVGRFGAASITISGGAGVACTGTRTRVAEANVSLATVDVLNAGSRWIHSGELQIGFNGTGSMNIRGGALVQSGSASLANFGTATVNVADPGSRWINSGPLSIGGTGRATLNITGGGTVQSSGGIVGTSSVTLARVNVDGAGSRWRNLGDLTVGGNFSVDPEVNVSNGALLESTSATIGKDGRGSVDVDGAGSQWNNSGMLIVGQGGHGIGGVHIDDGGRVTSAGAILGSQALASNGFVSLFGPGSEWINSGDLLVGEVGPGTMQVFNGGRVTNVNADIGRSTGAVHVGGTNSTWNNNGDVAVGAAQDNSSGSLLVSLGGLVTAQLMDVPLHANNNTGTVTVTGANSRITVLAMTVGSSSLSAQGTVNVDPGGTVNAGFLMLLGDRGTVNLNGGTLMLGSIQFDTTPTFNFNSGTLRFTEAITFTGAFLDDIFGPSHTILPLRHLMLDRTPTLQSLLVLDGGILTLPSLAVGSPLQFDSGTFNLTLANFTVGSTGLFGSTVVLDDRTINVTNSTTISPGGRLFMQGGNFFSGTGITNNGEIVLDSHLSQFTGGLLTNNGLISGNGRITNIVQNNGAGRIEADPGDELIFDNAVSNAGVITSRDAILRFNGGLTNNGVTQFTVGSSQIFGNIAHNGEVRVSTGANARFFNNITGVGSFTGSGTKFFEAGSTASLGAVETSGNTVVETGATLSATRIREQSLTVSGNAGINPNGTNAAASRLATLAITGGKFDLNNNDLIVTATPLATIRNFIATARNGGAWYGAGLTSSTARNHPQHATTLGLLSGAEYTPINGTTFAGLVVAPTDSLVKYTWYGDADFNGVVNFDDYARIDAGFSAGRTGWLNGDFDHSGLVNFDDYALIDLAFNAQSGTLIRAMDWLEGEDRSMRGMDDPSLHLVIQHYTQFGNAYATSLLNAVPEPSISALVVVAMASSLARRRRRRQ